MQVDKGRLIQETVTRIIKVAEGEGLLLQPHKKDRSVYVVRCDGQFEVLENGFSRQRFTVGELKLKKLLKTICKREFPRSNKVWMSKLTSEESATVIQKWR